MWVVVVHIVEVNRRRDAHTDLLAVPGSEHLFDCFREKADSIRRSTPIFICSMVRPRSEKLIDQVSICRVNFDPVKASLFRVDGCQTIIFNGFFDPAIRLVRLDS